MPLKKYSILVLLFSAFIFTACDDLGNDPESLEISSLYVTNEGSFSEGNGSITAFNIDSSMAERNAFESANGRPMAGIIQSASTHDGRMYISLNRADKIEVLDLQNLSGIATIPVSTSITALEVIDESKAYATSLYNSVAIDSISIIDLESSQETDERIAVGDQPRDMVQVDNRVFVANTGFGGSGNTISVIDTDTDEVVQTIEVGIAPVKLVLDSNNQIWVVCNGLVAYDKDFNRDPENDQPGSIYLIDGENGAVIDEFTIDGHPNDLVLDENNSRGFVLDSGVKVMSLTTGEVSETLFGAERTGALFYSAREELLYVGIRPEVDEYSQPGQVVRYNLDGAAVDSFQTGIAPNGFISVDG